jgi:hypothetical protein
VVQEDLPQAQEMEEELVQLLAPRGQLELEPAAVVVRVPVAQTGGWVVQVDQESLSLPTDRR